MKPKAQRVPECWGRTKAGKNVLWLNTLQTVMSSFSVLIISVGTSIVLSRGLLPEGKGLLTGLTLWSGLVLGTLDISIDKVSTYQWGRVGPSRQGPLLGGLLVTALCTSTIAVIALVWIVPLVVGGRYTTSEMDAAKIYFFTIGLRPFVEVASGIMAAENRFGLQNSMKILVPVTYTSIYLIIWAVGKLTVVSCLATLSAMNLLGAIPFFWVLASRITLPIVPDRRLLWEGFWYGFKGHIGNVANSVGGNALQSVVFVGLSPKDLAFFNTAKSTAGLGWAIPSALATTSFPRMVGRSAGEVHEQAMRGIRRALATTVLTNIVMVVAVPVLIPLLFGSRYSHAIGPAEIFLVQLMFSGPSLLLGNALDSTGRTLQGSVATVVNYSVSLAGTFLAVREFGLLGTAASSVVGQVAGLLVRFMWYRRSLAKIRLIDMMPRKFDFVDIWALGVKSVFKQRSLIRHEAMAGAVRDHE